MNSHIFSTYSGWKKSCTGWYVTVYPIIIGFQTFGGAGIRNHPQYFWTTTLFGRCFSAKKLIISMIQMKFNYWDHARTSWWRPTWRMVIAMDDLSWPCEPWGLWTLVQWLLFALSKPVSREHQKPMGVLRLPEVWPNKKNRQRRCWLQGLGIGSTGPDAYEFQGWHGMLAAKDCNQFLGAQQFCWENSQKCHGNPQGVHPC